MFRIVLHAPEIPPNTGNVIRLAANTGVELHLVRPLGFTLETPQLRRAGLDYHDLADVRIHDGTEAMWAHLGGLAGPPSVYAFTTSATRLYTDVAYAAGDVLMFGSESVGLPTAVLAADAVTDRIRLPMLPTSRSLNLANSAAVATFEAWRQHGFADPATPGGRPARRA